MATTRTSFTLPVEVMEKLKKLAKKEDRSASNVVSRILKEFFKNDPQETPSS